MRFPASRSLIFCLALGMGLSASLISAQTRPTGASTSTAVERNARPVLPAPWQPGEFDVPNRRYTLEVARFPSSALASGVRTAFENMGWGPIEQVKSGNEEVIYLGSFGSVADATYAARDLTAQNIATAKIVSVPEGVSFSSMGIDGPLTDPFVPSNPSDPRLLSDQAAQRQVRLMMDSLPPRIADPGQLALERLDLETEWSALGEDAGTLAVDLARLKTDAPLAFYLARRVASGQWPASAATRARAGEVVADLQYGWLRDWRGAWASSVALLEDPARDAAGRARDRLRLAALEIDLAAAGGELRPDWNRVRLQLRRAWDEVPLNAEREQAKIELVYLQTFAWQGNWARVEELGRDFAARYGTRFPHEAGLAKLTLARSLERREAWEEALEILDRHFAGRPLPTYDGLFMGFEPLDLTARYRETRQRLVASRIDAESQAISEQVTRLAESAAE